ncbi:DNA repair protein RecO [Tumebacillus permanentifrigoris]|uniref:DNA repair protein RecO n=1 Tax=Tumebacillus permanentifrigoris TaxID=378543 RepID=A0A316D553_9BACL|nr:DNA repair protein RecO [Tumebacillus permanentifrigoris]PWK08412.1 DNA replication and repair protein RecO [Tumebacillus permanentifrigoris]
MKKVDALVLRTIDYGESHKILTLLTPTYGKIAVMARGAKKPSSQLGSISQPFTYGTYLLMISERGMGTVAQADLIDSFRKIREDLFKTAYASYMMELIDRFTEEREPSAGIFLLALTLLSYLADDKDPEVLMRLTEVKMLDFAGIRPDLFHCANCGQPVETTIRFSIIKGGPLCSDCQASDERAIWIKPATLRLLQTFQAMDVRRLGEINVGEDVRRQMNKVLRQYYDEYSGVQLRTRAFLDQLHKYELDF